MTPYPTLETLDTRPDQFIVVTGDVIEGFQFCGPFGSLEIAHDYATAEDMHPWSIVRLDCPDRDTLVAIL